MVNMLCMGIGAGILTYVHIGIVPQLQTMDYLNYLVAQRLAVEGLYSTLMFFGYVSLVTCIVILAMYWNYRNTWFFKLTVLSSILVLIAQIVIYVYYIPVSNEISQFTADSVPAGWDILREQWSRPYRLGLAAWAFLMQITAFTTLLPDMKCPCDEADKTKEEVKKNNTGINTK